MKVKELKRLMEELDEELEIYIRYGEEEQVSDIEIEFVPFDATWNIDEEDSYLICSNGQNIKNVIEL